MTTQTSYHHGANILKRVIEYLCSDQWNEDRADALEIVNCALEECFESERIIHESPDGRYWVGKVKAGYAVFQTGLTHSESIATFALDADGLSCAIAYCDCYAARAAKRAATSR